MHADIGWVRDVCDREGFIPDAVCFSDGNRNELGICPHGVLQEESQQIPGLFNCRTFCIDHHYAHLLSAWPVTSNVSEVGYGVSVDGRGDNNTRLTIIRTPFSARPEPVFTTENREYCRLFNLIGIRMGLSGLEIDYAGKIMGAQAYGSVDPTLLEQCDTDYYYEHPLELLSVAEDNDIEFSMSDQRFRDWLATIHTLLGKFILRNFVEHIPFESTLVYAGGGAQNTVFNEMLIHDYPNMIIPPHCYDGGISLGCLKFLELVYGGGPLRISEFPFSQSGEDLGYAFEKTIRRVAELLAHGKIVGWVQGRAEIGPRALGHRSLLMDPSTPDGKNILNDRVKKREYWRPFAASSCVENTEALTGSAMASPYMLRATLIDQRFQPALHSAIHIDGTSRIQTVDSGGPTASFYELLKCFKGLTGVCGVLNTSLNNGGKPIVSGKDDAMEFYYSSAMDAICVGDQIWEKT
jgi:carbamoyltransferase